ncbi:MAG: Asp-tRNA(Asn)/Glu-tRNA(Gln) amidotransferase subunit GatC [Holosporaceae bacterium]|jgi:aspartyl-tRNA(Asn)/glutamyl-tRNA(Gln) amidotransferase subunit C|nr:Asp-tRNA(Asn)/Glu-tRNA(Gln) amidotransferase subunit GatC [Holosporaceae bacterium]
MSVTEEDVRKVSHLARIRSDDSKIEGLRNDLNRILGFVEQLNEVDCSLVDDSMQYVTTLHERKDMAVTCDPAVMDNATKKECNMFVVPKVVG